MAKWDIFTEHIAHHTFKHPDNFTTLKVDKLLDHWYFVVNKALNRACPKRHAKLSPTERDWYDDDLKYLHNRTKRKHVAHRKSSAPCKRKTFVKAKRAYAKACRHGKKRSWRLFVEKTPNELNMAARFRIALKRDRQTINTLRKPDGSLTEPGSEMIRMLTDTHFPAATQG